MDAVEFVSGVVSGGSGGAPGCGGHATHERPDLLEVCLVRRPSTPIISILRLVLLEMPIEIGLLAEAPVAMTTPERTLFIMNISHVPLQIRRY